MIELKTVHNKGFILMRIINHYSPAIILQSLAKYFENSGYFSVLPDLKLGDLFYLIEYFNLGGVGRLPGYILSLIEPFFELLDPQILRS